jgi:hypothetical protein
MLVRACVRGCACACVCVYVYVCVCVCLFVIHIFVLQAENLHMIYPKDVDHAALARHVPTRKAEYIDLLSVTTDAESLKKIKRVEILIKLEQIQINIAHCKALSLEEENVTQIEPQALIRITLPAGKLAPKISTLSATQKEFVNFLATLDAAEFSDQIFSVYKFQDMPKQLEDVIAEITTAAIKRWHKGLNAITTKLTDIIPESWRENCIDSMDEEYIKENIVTPAFIQGIGADYSRAKSWLESFQQFQSIKELYEATYKDELSHATALMMDTKLLVSLALVYNTILSKIPACKNKDEKKQMAANLKKKLLPPKKSNEPQQACIVPEVVMNRLTAACK